MKAGSAANWTNGPIPVIAPEYNASLLAATSDMALAVSSEGIIKSVLNDKRSEHHARLAGWVGKSMNDVLTVESRPKFENALEIISTTGELERRVELNHTDSDGWTVPMRYSFHSVGPGDLVLMLGKDLSIVAETQEQLVQAQVALERGYEERREHDARYRVVMATTRDAIVFVSSDGRVRDVNAAAAGLLSADVDHLIGAPIAKEFKNRRRGEFVESLLNVAMSDFETDMVVQTARGNRELKITPSVFRAAGERVIICRLSPAGPDHRVDDQLHSDLNALFQRSTDGIVLCDANGYISEANEAFLELADVTAMSEVKAKNFGDFLQRGQIDLNVMLENTIRSGHMRIYSTRLVNDGGAQAAVEISSVLLTHQDNPGVAFIVRDADRASAMRQATQPANTSEAPNQNVVELVGSATLKEIVAETSDVIEKMCIQTAVELTRNNRAAAAEMLGVSRQSLYVKLRKYGLLKRDAD